MMLGKLEIHMEKNELGLIFANVKTNQISKCKS